MLALPNDPARLKMKIRLIAGAGGRGGATVILTSGGEGV